MYHKNKKEMMNKVKQYVEGYYTRFHRIPSNAEVAAEFGIDRTTVYRYLKELKASGHRFDMIEKTETDMISVPLAGVIPCGSPEMQVECVDRYYAFPRELLGNGEFFMLTASGESMIDAGIDSGDLVIVRKQLDAYDGDIVAALVGNESTLKTFLSDEKGRHYLHPENSSGLYKDIKDPFSIQGVAVRVIKKIGK